MLSSDVLSRRASGAFTVRGQSILPVVATFAVWASGSAVHAVTPHLGFAVAAKGGTVVVTEVFPDTPAVVLGIQPGDVVERVDKSPVTLESLRRAMKFKRAGARVHLTMRRGREVEDMEVRLIDADDPTAWADMAATTDRELKQKFRKEMDQFVVKNGPIRIVGVQIKNEAGRHRIEVRIANVSEHFLEACDMGVLLKDSAGRPVPIEGQDNPFPIRSKKEVPPTNYAATQGFVTLEHALTSSPEGAVSAGITVTHARLANGQKYSPEQPQPITISLDR